MFLSLDRALQPIQSDRTREMLFEDFMGFGVLRSLIDLLRPIFFRNSAPLENKINPAAARERIIREACSITTDNVSAGVFAYGMAKLADSSGKSFAGSFINRPTMQLFEGLLKTSATPGEFKANLAKAIAPNQAGEILRLLPPKSKAASEAAFQVAEKLGLSSLDVTIGRSSFGLNGLLEDAGRFMEVTKAGKTGWNTRAMSMVRNTLKANSRLVPMALIGAAALTLSVSFFNNMLTRKLDGIESYPGELGLRMPKLAADRTEESWMERNLPYISKTLKNGKILPTLVSLLPLPFAMGLVDTVKLARGEGLVKALVKPGKGFGNKLLNMYQFTKGFPFTTQQQMASLFAFLITSRLLSSRSDIEYRERLVDSFAGWGLWIIATPRLKTFFAKRFDALEKTQLMKKVGSSLVLKSRSEIARLIKSPVIRSRTLKRFAMINAASTAITLLLMGIIEPIIAVKWSESQAKQDKQRALQASTYTVGSSSIG